MPLHASRGPQRIVCLTEEPTEILYALGEGQRIVGISAYTERPVEARRDKPVVSAFTGGSVEKIVALSPDLVIGFSDIQAELARSLIAANLQVLIFNQRSIQEILDVILSIGRLVDRADRALELVHGYITRLDDAARRAATRAAGPRVYFEEWDEPMISGIQWVSELIELAGGVDIFSDRARGKSAKERFVNAELVLERRPDIMLVCWCGKAMDRSAILSRPGMNTVPAVRSGHIYELPPAIILQPGPACLTAGLELLEELIGAHSEPQPRS